MRNLQKPTMILLMICLVMTMLISPASNVQAAKKKIKISKKSVTLVVGKKVTIKVKNAPKGKKSHGAVTVSYTHLTLPTN